MQTTSSSGGPKHTLVIALVLALSGILIWIIQLARQGDPVGYIILTGLGMLLALPVTGAVLALLLRSLGRLQPPPRDDLKSIHEAHRVLRDQNRYLTQLLAQAQKNPALLAGGGVDAAPSLGPGQVRTPEGFIIDGAAFDVLDDDEAAP